MEVGLSNTLLAGDPRLVDHIVGEVKSQGIFDQFRKECIADVDTKPAYQNLHTRVEGSVNSFLAKQVWKADLNKNQLRETLRKHIHEAPYLDTGVERIVDQVVNPKVYSVFMPQIEDVVYKFLGLERPKAREKNGSCGLKDLLPKDLDPVSPESDKNSLKDVSLESVDANMDNIDVKNDETSLSINEQKSQFIETIGDDNSDNAQFLTNEKRSESPNKISSRTASNSNINNSLKSDDKVEEDEEDSPVFEPIDIMNLNESNISNDSHLSGISELTSHRSRSPDFSNDFSRDNLDFSNQDSQLSKVSSDSRLSIVTDFSCSNHASTPLPDTSKDDSIKEEYAKDNFKAIREFETSKHKDKNASDLDKYKDNLIQESKSIKSNLSSKESSRDATDSAIKDKYESKDKSRDSDSFKSKSSKEKSELKSYKDKEKDYKKKQNRDSSLRNEKYSKDKSKDKTETSRMGTEKSRDSFEKSKEAIIKPKEERVKDSDKKDIAVKEVKDLKDIYKEKIRELREKKELTEKEKLNKDNKDNKSSKEFKDRKDSSKDKKDKKDYKVSSYKNASSSRPESKSAKIDDKSLIKTDNKSSTKSVDSKDTKNESKDKGKRDDRRYSKDSKSKSYSLMKSDSAEKFDKTDIKKLVKTDKDDKTELKKDMQKLVTKKESKYDILNKDLERGHKADNKKEAKVDSQIKERKRRDEKKSKSKDEHCSLRKNSSDRRSTDRDGSNGSNGRSSQKSNSSSSTSSGKAVSSSITKESSNTSNSSSETSDGIEESQLDELKNSSIEPITKVYNESCDHQDQTMSETKIDDSELNPQKLNLGSLELTLPLKKRPLLVDDASSNLGENRIKKPKFAKNIFEAKKLMKVRKRMEKRERLHNEELQRKLEVETVKELQPVSSPPPPKPSDDPDNISTIPDEERVQIVEIPDEDYEQPYPEKQTNLTLKESSFVILEGEPSLRSNAHSTLSEMELSIRQSLTEMISDTKLIETTNVMTTIDNPTEPQGTAQAETNHVNSGESQKSPLCSKVLVNLSSRNPEIININQTMSEQQSSTNAIQESLTNNEKSKEFIENQEIQNIPLRVKDTSHADKYIEESQNIDEIIKSSTSAFSNQNDTIQRAESSVRIKEDPIKISTVLNLESECSTTHVSKESKHHDSDTEESEKQEISKLKSSMGHQEECLYFQADNEKYLKFSSFLKSYEPDEGAKSLEQMIESLGGQMVSSFSKTMAPPLPKRKHSTSPLSDILINTSNNNNDGHKMLDALADHDGPNSIKKRKLARVKKQRTNSGPCTPHNLLNGENFVMPLSPESDVSATSEKIPSHPIKDDKSRQRSSQRYSSDDLYKPRPLFSSSSRRSRRSNQA
ncbi:biorientation of chromosomes in cell division protein 1-like 1 [Cephus cinctus]|uniref:Biorientation of chromosomes in cell division protein 1-like 1 n=1 Tax=Cephus cinctus TaxID=211228 RepID=A0AAJ7FCS6_CEPCN|nr:biorientation of chromosomes in cell division protein 1-like 1 [Cephus cinctus]